MAKGKVSFDIKGLDEVKKILKQLPTDIADRVQLDVNRSAATKIGKPELEQSSPVGDNDKPARAKIENNVIVTKGKTKTSILLGFAKRAFHVLFIENGSSERKKDTGQSTGKIDASPFVENAHDRILPKIVSYLNANYLKLINRSIKKNLKKIKK